MVTADQIALALTITANTVNALPAWATSEVAPTALSHPGHPAVAAPAGGSPLAGQSRQCRLQQRRPQPVCYHLHGHL